MVLFFLFICLFSSFFPFLVVSLVRCWNTLLLRGRGEARTGNRAVSTGANSVCLEMVSPLKNKKPPPTHTYTQPSNKTRTTKNPAPGNTQLFSRAAQGLWAVGWSLLLKMSDYLVIKVAIQRKDRKLNSVTFTLISQRKFSPSAGIRNEDKNSLHCFCGETVWSVGEVVSRQVNVYRRHRWWKSV